MGLVLGFLLIFVILLLILLVVSVGVAALLHWLLPAVGMEMALLVAVVAVGQAMLIFGRMINSLPLALDEPPGEDGPPPIVILDREVTLPRRRRKRP